MGIGDYFDIRSKSKIQRAIKTILWIQFELCGQAAIH